MIQAKLSVSLIVLFMNLKGSYNNQGAWKWLRFVSQPSYILLYDIKDYHNKTMPMVMINKRNSVYD